MTETTQQEAVIHITGPQQFLREAESFDGVTLVDFRAPRCMPCKMLGPIIEELGEDYKENPKVKIIKVDTQHPGNQELAMKYQVNSIPNVYILKDGKVAENLVWLRQKEEYKRIIDELIS